MRIIMFSVSFFMTPQEEIEILKGGKEFKEISFPMLFLEGLLYSILSFGLVIGAFHIIQKVFPPSILLNTNALILIKSLIVLFLSSLIFALSKTGNATLMWRVFVRTLLVGVVCSLIIFISFFALFRFIVSLDDIIGGIVKISGWRTGTIHFREVVIAFAAVFLMAYPILFMSVKYTLHRIFWSNEDELLA
ncbi:MAG: hypothetical protein SFU27_03160 [Thermonemataceae bacterium]|nr:hypothetical protein [Thermonemataceae bacterium]